MTFGGGLGKVREFFEESVRVGGSVLFFVTAGHGARMSGRCAAEECPSKTHCPMV